MTETHGRENANADGNRARGQERAEHSANGSSQVQCGAEELSRLAEQLREGVEQFRL